MGKALEYGEDPVRKLVVNSAMSFVSAVSPRCSSPDCSLVRLPNPEAGLPHVATGPL